MKRIKVGDTITRQAINGHAFEYEVVGFYDDGSPRTGSSWNAPHSDRCGCHAEPSEYDPMLDW